MALKIPPRVVGRPITSKPLPSTPPMKPPPAKPPDIFLPGPSVRPVDPSKPPANLSPARQKEYLAFKATLPGMSPQQLDATRAQLEKSVRNLESLIKVTDGPAKGVLRAELNFIKEKRNAVFVEQLTRSRAAASP